MKKRVEPGHVFWLTGLAGAGKSTIGMHLDTHLKGLHKNTVLVDGDKFRDIVGDDLGHTSSERLENAWRIARFCSFLSKEGINVVVATVSLYQEVRQSLRDELDRYFVIYIKASDASLYSRDQKGLYSGARAGTTDNVAGVNQDIELPENPDLVIQNDCDRTDFEDIVQEILALSSF